MKPDIYLKTVLTVIAFCLVILTIKFVPAISMAKADEGSTHCSGSLTAQEESNSESLLTPTTPQKTGDYDIALTCEQE